MPSLEAVEPDFANTASRTVVVERTIDATPSDLWSIIADNVGWPAWFPGMKRCDTTSAMATGVGATRTVKVGALEAEERFVAWDAPRVWAFCVTRTNIPIASKMYEQLELEPADGGTLVRYTGAFEPHRLNRLVFGLIEKNVRGAWTKGLDGLAARAAEST